MRKLALTALLALTAGACGDAVSSLAYGDFNSIIAVMEPSLWEEVGDDMYGALEPTILTVRDEKTFTVTYQDPSLPEWSNLRRFRQMLLVGTGDEPWMQDALAKVEDPVDGPGLYHAFDVWARGQQATIIVVTPEDAAAQVRSHLAEINTTLDEQFRGYARTRMFMSGVDSALADTLMTQARFQVILPDVYRWSARDSTYIFRNDNPDPAELIRQITVTWKSPIPPDMSGEGLLEWRAATAAVYAEPQNVDLSQVDAGPFEFRGRPAYQIQALWTNPPELNWPAAGPFIARGVICPEQNRMYLLDAWLYAPGKEKYEYMVQLQTILDSFRCGPA
ncbi:MAG TPA: DUF4837 family protein [Longimicrobiales bacterium]|nr:DUF4837 family protein [Longimicrobiales bacterium]